MNSELGPSRESRVQPRPTRRLKTSETVAREIVRDVVARGLQPGDHLLSEAAMLGQYGVSRESLREGLRLLEVHGLITIRRGPGGGPIVCDVDPGDLGRVSTLFFHLARGTYAELFDTWAVSEGVLAERAAMNPDRETTRLELEPFVSGPTGYGSPPVELAEFVEVHGQFHAVVARLARNRILGLSFQAAGRIATHHVVANLDPRQLEDDIERDHERVADAIVTGQAREARNLMEDHIRHIAAFSAAQLGPDRMDEFIEWR